VKQTDNILFSLQDFVVVEVDKTLFAAFNEPAEQAEASGPE
jgi:hypothetical protein